MEETLRFVLPSIPPSVNALYYINFKTREVGLKPEIIRWKGESKGHIPAWKFTDMKSGMLQVNCTFTYNFYHQNGKLRQFDTPNLLKALFDVIAEKIGVDDKFLKSGSFTSTHSETVERVEVEVKFI